MKTKAIRAIESIAKTAIESSCGCARGPGHGNGYLKHDKSCWVHIQREDYKTVFALIDSLKRKPAKA